MLPQSGEEMRRESEKARAEGISPSRERLSRIVRVVNISSALKCFWVISRCLLLRCGQEMQSKSMNSAINRFLSATSVIKVVEAKL